MKKILSVLLCICLLAGVFAACTPKSNDADSDNTAADNGFKSANGGTASEREPVTMLSYDDIYEEFAKVNSLSNGWATADAGMGMDMAVTESAPTAAAEAPMDAADDADSGGSRDYSGTNTQVDGVDEGDIVKTDGDNIYVLRNGKLHVFKADGADTKLISTVTVCKGYEDLNDYEDDKFNYRFEDEYAYEMYVSGDRVAVTTTYNMSQSYYEGDTYKYEDKNTTYLYIYDVSNPSAPTLVTKLGQDGYHLASRLIGDTVYLVSNYYIYNEIDPEEPGTFIPCVYDGAESTLIARDCIMIMPYRSSTAYTVICSYSLDSAEQIDTKSILGGGTTVYMNGENLYLAASSTDESKSDPRKDGVYTVVDYSYESVTDITKFSVSDGVITYNAAGTVPGSLLNQFSLDEHNGHLRVVTTTYRNSWTEYTDEARGWTNYEWDEDVSANALYVLDSSMGAAGSITDVAEGEIVYSVRFSGDIGYFVTFRQTDPLFAVDLSNPNAPKILSALKIPGFSQYMHVYSDGLLLGIGREADEDTGIAGKMKLSMFDVSDPADVTEKDVFALDYSYSEALYNHKAILVAPDKNIIAFPSEKGYDIYGYSADSGFSLRASISNLGYGYNARGLYIDDFAYIVTESSVSVLDLETLTLALDLDY